MEEIKAISGHRHLKRETLGEPAKKKPGGHDGQSGSRERRRSSARGERERERKRGPEPRRGDCSVGFIRPVPFFFPFNGPPLPPSVSVHSQLLLSLRSLEKRQCIASYMCYTFNSATFHMCHWNLRGQQYVKRESSKRPKIGNNAIDPLAHCGPTTAYQPTPPWLEHDSRHVACGSSRCQWVDTRGTAMNGVTFSGSLGFASDLTSLFVLCKTTSIGSQLERTLDSDDG